jgi:hypothetical protein
LLTGPERYGVRLLGDGPDLLLEEQREALEEALLPYLSPDREGAFARFLCWAETTCLDTAGLGLVLAVPPVGRFVNRLDWRSEWPTPTVKTDAGWPDELWHPPGELDEGALDRIRSRTINPDRADVTSAWACVALEAWWSLAATFCRGATVVEILGDGQPVTDLAPASVDPVHGPASFGTLLPLTPQPQSETPCDATATLPYATVGLAPRVEASREVPCPFVALPTSHRCRLHDLTVIA